MISRLRFPMEWIMGLTSIKWLNRGHQLSYSECLRWRSLDENASDISRRHQDSAAKWNQVSALGLVLQCPRILFGNIPTKNLLAKLLSRRRFENPIWAWNFSKNIPHYIKRLNCLIWYSDITKASGALFNGYTFQMHASVSFLDPHKDVPLRV